MYHMEDTACKVAWSVSCTVLEDDLETTACFYQPDGTSLATGTQNGCVRLWNAAGETIETHQTHANQVLALKWDHQSRLLASGGLDKVLEDYLRLLFILLHSN